MRFPDGFLWGAATAAYQIEGATTVAGRGRSIWDTFAHTPGLVANGDTGDVAADHYRRFADDVRLMQELGLRAYRFSIAWPRVQPDGRGPANVRGIDFYRRLVAALVEAKIEPVPTLYHWDLPQALQDAGGWPARDTATRFADYAELVISALADSGVRTWLTLNEPWCSAFLGYGLGRHAPGVHDAAQAVQAVHHLLLGHGLAVERVRAVSDASVGIVLNLEPMRPAASPADDAAARLADGMQNRIFLDPIFRGAYPDDVLDHLRAHVPLSHIRDADLATIGAPIDVLGVNYYRPTLVALRATPADEWSTWPGDEALMTRSIDGPQTAMGWGIDADGLREILVRVRNDYGDVPMLVTENGAAYDDVPAAGRIDDAQRVDYLDAHLRAVRLALDEGVDVRGYFVWSLLDNFEWAEGYAKRFGIVYVDYATQRRLRKRSADWYARVIAANALPERA